MIAKNQRLEALEYKPLSNVAQFKKDAAKVLGGYSADLSGHKEIYKNNKLIGYIGLEEYKGQPDDDFNKALGISDFMTLERGKGYGTEVIKDLVDSNKDKYDLIYCFVDADNKGAINLYKMLGKVYDEEGPNDNNQYYVTFWDTTRKLEESDHTQKAIETLGTTYYKTRAGFMLKDGRLLDLTYGGNPREDHRAIQDAFDDVNLETGSDYLIEFMNEGNIRLIPEIPGIDIVKEPTEAQWKALKDYISYMVGRNHYFMLQFSNEKGQQIDWKEYNGFGTASEILMDLQDYFEGKLNESWYDDDPWSMHEPQTVSELLGTKTLYHATYKPYWEEIQKDGFIRPGKHSNWPDIFKTYRYTYLSVDYDNAVSYAETAEDVPEEYLDQIVVLEINADKLDVNSISADENQIYDSWDDEGRSIEDPSTWVELEYDKPIPVSAIRKVHDESKLEEGLQTQILQKATPYMLRNDGQLFRCHGYHPYICNVYDQENDLESLVNERVDELQWFFENTRNTDVKKYIQIIVNSSCKFQLVYLDTPENLQSKFKVTDDTYSCADEKELYSILEWTNAETNQEFCRVRTSDLKLGGSSGDIYFRISSIGFNWFPLIWNLVYSNKNWITNITISRDGSARDFNQKECYQIKGIQISHLPIDQFLTISGNPIIEEFHTSLPILAEAYRSLCQGKTLSESYPNQHPRTILGFYRRQVREELAYDLNHLLSGRRIFNLKKIGMSHYDEWLNSQSARDRDNVRIEIKELSPKEYLKACAEIFGNIFDSQKKQVQQDKEIIEELQDLIKKGVSLNATFLDYVSNPPTQEGRHRMYALAELYGWDKKYPVIIFTPADPEKAKKDQLERQREKLYKYIDKAVTSALDYTYRNYDELKDQISYYLENYIDNPEVKISERGHWLVITVNGLEYEISQDEFDWDEDKPDLDDDFDIEDLI